MKKSTILVPASHSKQPRQKAPESAVHAETGQANAVSVAVGVLAVLAVVWSLYVGKEVVLPIVLALVLKLMLQPIMNVLCDRLHVPHAVSAIVLILCIFGIVVAVALTISVPASAWIQRIPEILPDLQQKLEGLRRPIEYLQQAFSAVEKMASSAGPEPATPQWRSRTGRASPACWRSAP